MKTEDQKKGAAGECSTVRVKADNEYGFAVIDEDDFDPKKHEKYEAPKAKAEAKAK